MTFYLFKRLSEGDVCWEYGYMLYEVCYSVHGDNARIHRLLGCGKGDSVPQRRVNIV